MTNPPASNTAPAPSVIRPQALAGQIAIDHAIRGLAVAALVVLLVTGSLWEGLDPNLFTLVMLGAAGLWVFLGSVSAKVWRRLPAITLMIDANPDAAEAQIAQELRRKPLQRAVRLLLFHRLALLRHRQHRYPEAAALCAAVLQQRLGAAAVVRGHLLLMLAESRLETNDLPGCFTALTELHRQKLSLVESLHRLALQTRYEVACGYHLHALQGLPQKIGLIELMPNPQCGNMHALLAIAAAHAQQDHLADWLRRRAELLCTPEELASFPAPSAVVVG